MVPLQAMLLVSFCLVASSIPKAQVGCLLPTELLLDDLQDLFLVEFLGKPLHSGQGLTTITFCGLSVAAYRQTLIVARAYVGSEYGCNFGTA